MAQFTGSQAMAGYRADSNPRITILPCVGFTLPVGPLIRDPLLALYLSRRLFPGRGNYGPIAGAGLSKYKFFERLGFFGIDNRSRSGAVRFLRLGTAALRDASTSLWVTPQGHFTDVRTRPV